MAVSVKHAFVSAIPDSGDTTIVQPSNWNDEHTVAGLGTAAEADTADFATAAQGAKADSAVQPGDLATVATSGAYSDLSGTPTLGTAAAADTTDFATAAQGAKADSALQPAAIGVSVQAYDADLTAWAAVNPSSYSTTAQIAAAYQPLDSDLTAIAALTTATYGRSLLTLANATALAAEVDSFFLTPSEGNAAYQPLDSDLTAIAGLTRTRGDLIVGGASAWTDLALGTLGYALKSDGTDVVWAASREVLTANRTYYVRSDGSDSNTGLVDSSGGAFLTISKAISAALALDPSIYDVTIVLQNGTWGGVSMGAPMIGNKSITIQGSSSANVTLSSTVAANATAMGASLTLTGLTLNGTTNCINVTNGGTINIGSDIVFAGNSSGAHIRTNGPGSTVQVNANYSITSGAARHFMASPNGFINAFARTITLSGTLSFSTAFAVADRGALISTNGSTFTGGTITGKRYDVQTNAVIYTGGAGASHFPGDSTGTAATGGQYA